MNKFIWLSRHPLTKDQESSLRNLYPDPEFIIEHVPHVFPLDTFDCIADLEEILTEAQFEDMQPKFNIIGYAGVFPAYMLAHLVEARITGPCVGENFGTFYLHQQRPAYLPVAAPVEAKHGEPRTFKHVRWEAF